MYHPASKSFEVFTFAPNRRLQYIQIMISANASDVYIGIGNSKFHLTLPIVGPSQKFGTVKIKKMKVYMGDLAA